MSLFFRKTFEPLLVKFTGRTWTEIDWPVALFLVLNPLIVMLSLPIYFYFSSAPGPLILFSLIFAAATNLSITAGYHRLFAHRSYEAHPVVRWIYLFIGAGAFQGSALKWASDHRRHHGQVDTDQDPYSIKRGFFFAHMGWMFLKESMDLDIKAPDLEKDKWVVRQNRYYLIWAIGAGYLFPTLVGWILGSFWGGLLIAGGLRIFLTQQSTFFVNSLCHTLGRQTYSKEVSARDSFFVAVLTHGEGYHNFHHKFQIDYRNGIKWYHWDPTKWTIVILKWIGLAEKLRTISAQEILKARLQVEAMMIRRRGISQEKIERIKEKVIEAQKTWKALVEDYELRKTNLARGSHLKIVEMKQSLEEFKIQIKRAKADFQFAMEEWHLLANSLDPA